MVVELVDCNKFPVILCWCHSILEFDKDIVCINKVDNEEGILRGNCPDHMSVEFFHGLFLSIEGRLLVLEGLGDVAVSRKLGFLEKRSWELCPGLNGLVVDRDSFVGIVELRLWVDIFPDLVGYCGAFDDGKPQVPVFGSAEDDWGRLGSHGFWSCEGCEG